MKYMKLISIVVFSCLYLNSPFIYADVVVIANTANPASTATPKALKKLFMGKSSSLGGSDVIPVDLAEGNAVRNEFYTLVAKKNATKMKNYWSKMIFSGKASPPKSLQDSAAVIAWVAKNKDAIGYVDAGSVDASVKVLLKLP